jgi:hypothetical protein
MLQLPSSPTSFLGTISFKKSFLRFPLHSGKSLSQALRSPILPLEKFQLPIEMEEIGSLFETR